MEIDVKCMKIVIDKATRIRCQNDPPFAIKSNEDYKGT